MAKRFTDTDKWKDSWFQDLPIAYKLFWFYLLDNCNMAGIWKVNLRLASFQIGQEIERKQIPFLFTNRIIVINSDEWFVEKFIKFQYGTLNSNCRPHAPVIKMLKEKNIKGYPYPLETSQYPIGRVKDKDQDQDKEQDKDKDKDKDSEKPNTLSPYKYSDPHEFHPTTQSVIDAWLDSVNRSILNVPQVDLEKIDNYVRAYGADLVMRELLAKKPVKPGFVLAQMDKLEANKTQEPEVSYAEEYLKNKKEREANG